MFRAKSLYRLIIFSILFILFLSSIFTFIILDNAKNDFDEKIITLKQSFVQKKKLALQYNINAILRFIKFYDEKYKNTKTKEELQQDVLQNLPILKDDTDEYIFIYDFDGKLLYNNAFKHKVGSNILLDQNDKDKKTIEKLIKISQQKNGGFVEYEWEKDNLQKEEKKLSFANSYIPWQWSIGQGVYLDEIEQMVEQKELAYIKKIKNYTYQIVFFTLLLILYSIFILKNITTMVSNDVKTIERYFEQSKNNDVNISKTELSLGEFKTILRYATNAINTIRLKTKMLEDLNKNLEQKVVEKTSQLTQLVQLQKKFIKHSVHEVNTPLSIIQTNIDLLKMKIPQNKYITNIQSGSKIIQNIYDDLSYLVLKDKIEYKKEYLNFSEFLEKRVEFFDEIAKSNSLNFKIVAKKDIYINFSKIKLQRIIDNNLSNAIKYSHANSNIDLELYYKNDDEIEFSVATKSDKIYEVDKIFNDFYRENDVKGGFGLGLNIVKQICENNNIFINVYSDDVTKFTYRFKINENITT